MWTVRPVLLADPAVAAVLTSGAYEAPDAFDAPRQTHAWILERAREPVGLATGFVTPTAFALQHFMIRSDARSFRAARTLWHAVTIDRQAAGDTRIICGVTATDPAAPRWRRLLMSLRTRVLGVLEGVEVWECAL